MIIVSRIIHVKVDRRLNVTNKIKYQRRLSSRLAIVMFRGTLCMINLKWPKQWSTSVSAKSMGHFLPLFVPPPPKTSYFEKKD